MTTQTHNSSGRRDVPKQRFFYSALVHTAECSDDTPGLDHVSAKSACWSTFHGARTCAVFSGLVMSSPGAELLLLLHGVCVCISRTAAVEPRQSVAPRTAVRQIPRNAPPFFRLLQPYSFVPCFALLLFYHPTRTHCFGFEQEELCLLRTLQPGKNLIGAGYAMYVLISTSASGLVSIYRKHCRLG